MPTAIVRRDEFEALKRLVMGIAVSGHATLRVLDADPDFPQDGQAWLVRDGGSPESVILKAFINGETQEIAGAIVT